MSTPDKPEYKKLTAGTIGVYLEGARVGAIIAVQGGWRYYPVGWRAKAGPTFPTIAEVKKELEGA